MSGVKPPPVAALPPLPSAGGAPLRDPPPSATAARALGSGAGAGIAGPGAGAGSLGWWRLYVDAIIGRPNHSVFIITYFIYYIFKLYCYLLYNAAFEYALITIGETASFSEGFLKGLSVGSSCSHVALSCLYSYRCAASSPVSTDTCTACTGI